jgi:ribosome-associated protein
MPELDPSIPPPSPGQELAPGVYAPADALRLQYSRSSGPGGQNVNKLNTRVELWVKLDALVGLHPEALQRLQALAGSRMTKEGQLHLTSDESRSQESNRQEVFARLRELILQAKRRPRPRRPTRPSRAARQRRLDEKKHIGEKKARRRGEA